MNKSDWKIATIFSGFAILFLVISVLPIHRISTHTNQPAVVMEVMDPSLEVFAPMWQAEIGRRFPHAVGVLVHGGDFVRGEWIVGVGIGHHLMRTDDLVASMKSQYPDRTIVLLACNTGHLQLRDPDVYYASASVWCVPDRALTPEMFQNGLANLKVDSGFDGEDGNRAPQKSRWQEDPEVVGNIWEFSTNE